MTTTTQLDPGTLITGTSTDGQTRHAGLLIPGRRLHTDDGTIVDLAAGEWLLTRTGPTAPKGSRRMMVGQHGPIYRYDDLPAQQLATATMLKKGRRKPADGHAPIASYWTGYDHVPLYAVADSVALPALSPKRQAAYDAARTCARCQAHTTEPYPKDSDGDRWCPACREADAKTRWDAHRAIKRAESTAWARGVLADPAALLVATDGGWSTLRVRIEQLDGTPIIDTTVVGRTPVEDAPTGTTSSEAFVDEFLHLDERRLVGHVWSLEGLNDLLRIPARDRASRPPSFRVPRKDYVPNRWDEWVGEPYEPPYYGRNFDSLRRREWPTDLTDQLAAIRECLAQMAETGSE